MSVYDYRVMYRTGDGLNLKAFKGKAMLIVNTASKCKLTPQFEGLQQLHLDYKDKGLQVLGFPCNQFANQDPYDDDTIVGICQKNYGVSFPVFSRINVNGPDASPLYKYLKSQARGFLWSKRIKWNFTKFLVDQEGNVVKRYAPTTKPEKLVADIEDVLKL